MLTLRTASSGDANVVHQLRDKQAEVDRVVTVQAAQQDWSLTCFSFFFCYEKHARGGGVRGIQRVPCRFQTTDHRLPTEHFLVEKEV